MAKIEGRWNGVSSHIDGFERPVAKWYKYTFEGNQLTTETSESEPATVKFYLDPQTEPKQLDTSIMVDGVEEISKGIYSIDDDVLRFSWRVVGERPVDFQSRELDEKIVIILHRATN
ncbi:MAG: TIGR03067 domain-containing protein [Planctomycetaceae bacterium]|nr:TIGR03067 domain-containing protein [Planctomycetaceae bacterium]MCB9951714.1 TIGR03067 domain-containing protein [Planctomycetaceae bacterium]